METKRAIYEKVDILEMVERFINWIENLQVGVDLLTQEKYRVLV
jgi:flavorubredoxin